MNYNVLVVDDEAPVRDLFRDLLKKQGCKLECSSSAEECLETIKNQDFDVILLDIKLPGMSGLDALKKIKESNPNIVVIMITGFGYDEELITKSKENGCDGYIGKNIPIAEIISSFKLFTRTIKRKQ